MKKTVKNLMILMVMVLIFVAVTITASAESFGSDFNLYSSFDSSTGELLITGKGEMDFNSYKGIPWKSYKKSIKTVIIDDGITNIAEEAFYNCKKLESVYIGKDVKSIDESAFEGCKSLKYVDLPEGLNTIDEGAFKGCTSLKQVYLPENLNKIGSYAFNGCTSLKYVNLPGSLDEIISGTFSGCTSLKYIDLPESLTVIGSYAFSSCSSLEDITIPNGVKTIGENAFYNCSKLKTITLPVSVVEIGRYRYTSSQYKYGDTFNTCDNLTDIYYSGTEEQWKNISYSSYVKSTINIHFGHTHNYLETNKVAASMTDDGLITYTCSTSGHNKNEIIPKIDSVSLSSDTLVYNGKVKTPAVSVKTAAGTVLVKDVDYTVSYAKGRTNVGKYSVTVNFKGNYVGKKTLKFTIAPKAPSISSIKYQDGGKANVTWKKIDAANGYQLQYATNSNFNNSKSVKITKKSTLSKVLTNISTNQMWYMRIRSYKTVSGKTYYSNWSAVKCIAVSINKHVDFDISNYISWSSKNNTVSRLEGIGNTVITLETWNGVKYTCYFYSLAYDVCLFTGDSTTLPKHNDSSALTWKSANTSLATVNKQTVKGVKQGNVKLTAKKANVTYTVNVHVYDYKTMNKKLENYMKNNLKDPDSLKIYNKWRGYTKDGYLVIKWDYGAANGFGGMNRDDIFLEYSYELGKFKSSTREYYLDKNLKTLIKVK